jgi:hypothetical protein
VILWLLKAVAVLTGMGLFCVLLGGALALIEIACDRRDRRRMGPLTVDPRRSR